MRWKYKPPHVATQTHKALYDVRGFEALRLHANNSCGINPGWLELHHIVSSNWLEFKLANGIMTTTNRPKFRFRCFQFKNMNARKTDVRNHIPSMS
jgi:hypothetical protein